MVTLDVGLLQDDRRAARTLARTFGRRVAIPLTKDLRALAVSRKAVVVTKLFGRRDLTAAWRRLDPGKGAPAF